jgi:hypothetical protein
VSQASKYESPIPISYYQGAYGPTIRIDLKSQRELRVFREMLVHLLNVSIMTLQHSREYTLEDIDSLTLRVLPDNEDKSMGLKLLSPVTTNPVFQWSQSVEGWEEAIDKINVFFQTDSPGHQYLTDESVDDALVEIAFREG